MLVPVVSNDETTDPACTQPHASRVVFTTAAGMVYRIAVAGFGAVTGTINGAIEPCTAAGADCPTPTVTTGSVSADTLHATGATLTGTVNPNGQATTYRFDWGTDTSYSGGPTPSVSAGSGTTDVSPPPSQTISGLVPGTMYHFRIEANNAAGTTFGQDQSFTTPKLPSATTTAATSVMGDGATLNGTINPNGSSTQYHFEWTTAATPPPYANSTAVLDGGSGTTDEAVSAQLTGLAQGTTVHYRVVAKLVGSLGETVNGADMTFTTTLSPAVTTNPATAVSTTAATLNGTVNPQGQATTYQFQYSTDMSFGTSVPIPAGSAGSGSSAVAESASITGLTPGTVYNFHITATNATGTSVGSNATFSTGAHVVTGAASGLTPRSATLNGTVNPNGQATIYQFDWGTDTSYTGGPTPSASAGSGTSDTSASQTISGLVPGQVYNFRIEATNAAGTTFGANQSFTTPPPPVPTTGIATSISSTQATLNGTVNPKGSATTYQFDWGPTTPYAFSTTSTSAGSDSTDHPESAVITRLTPGTTYHFRIEATNASGQVFGNDATFVAADPPTATTNAATSISGRGATLNGTVNPNGVATTYHFEYRTPPNFGTSTPESGAGSDSSNHSVSANIASLTPTTTYHFHIVATNSSGSTVGAEQMFTTLSPPSATTGTADSISGTGSTVHGTVNPQGQDTSFHFEYGTTTSYGASTTSASAGSDSSDHAESTAVTGLAPGTMYHFRIVATNATGTTNGADNTFTTLSPPSATTGTADSISGTGATVHGTVNPQGQATSFHFEYGTTTSYGTSTSSASAGSDSSDHAESTPVTGLAPGTTYHLRIVASNATGATNGSDKTFTTLSVPTAKTDPASPVSDTEATLNGTINPNGSDTMYHFEWGTTASYGNNTPTTDAGPGTTDEAVSAKISGLSQGLTYHFRVVATNGGGTTDGADRMYTRCVNCVDFNGDGKPDILFRNLSNGQVGVWTMNGTQVTGWQLVDRTVSSSSWVAVATGDFSGDGKPDVLFRNTRSGEVGVWTIDGTHVTGWQLVDRTVSAPTWKIAALGDFNGDGKPDVLFRNTANGQVGVWTMDGVHVTGWQLVDRTVSDPSWVISGTGDFNADGKPDILFRNTSNGQVGVWTMDGTHVTGWQLVDRTASSLSWVIAGTGDFNADGKPDILFRNTSNGQVGVWTMDGTHVTGWQLVDRTVSDPLWVIVY